MREMKNSGNQWIKEIPISWQIIKSKYVIWQNDGGIWGKEPIPGILNKMVLRSTEQTIDGKWDIVNPALRNLLGINLQSYRVEENDLLITKSSGSAKHIGKTTLADYRFIYEEYYYSNFLQRLKVKKVYPKFMWYILNSTLAREQFVFRQNSTSGIGNINAEDISSIYIPYPSKCEQNLIIKFLDKKCSEIDTIIENIQKQIEILEKYKRSIITEAVTKGLNPQVEMKDSGLDWIGKIPTHWDMHPIYFYFNEGKKQNKKNQENNLLSLSYGKIIKKDINTNGGLLPASFSTYNIVSKNDIIIRPTDLQNDKRSLRTGLVKEKGIITSAYIDLVPKEGVNSVFYHYLLHSYDIMKVFYNMGNGVRQGLNYNEFSKLILLSPPSIEQKEIADYLDKKCAEIEAIIADKQSQLETIEKYKKSLIYEYVTGKKEVA